MKAQDILIILKAQSLGKPLRDLPLRSLARETGVSLSEASAACGRLERAALLSPHNRAVLKANLFEFLVHGLKYVFPVVTGDVCRGMPTGYAAEPLRDHFLSSARELPPVWPDPEGTVRGIAIQPLYPSAPAAARKDKTLYEYLVLVDAIRGGRARERKLASKILSQWLG